VTIPAEESATLEAFVSQPTYPSADPTAAGNSPWARAMANELRQVVTAYSEHRPRSRQRRLGPSEIGTPCDRQVVGKLIGEPVTNHVTDPWPSYVGTALHAELERTFQWHDVQMLPPGKLAPYRWHTERRVNTLAGYTGTADLYDARTHTVLDHKCLGDRSAEKVRGPDGPSRRYRVQLAAYGLGYVREGYSVDRVALVVWPRTRSSLDDLFVWEHPFDDHLVGLLQDVKEDMDRRTAMADLVRGGFVPIEAVPTSPSHDECYFCPFFRPDGQGGCPGTKVVGWGTKVVGWGTKVVG
jgi:hypothetical protein